MASLETLNLRPQSWADATFTLTMHGGQSLPLEEITDISHATLVEVGDARGAGSRTKGETRGKLKDSGKMTLNAGQHDALVQALADVAPTKDGESLISLVYFDIAINHQPYDGAPVRQVELLNCRILGLSEDLKEGTDPDKVAVELYVRRVRRIINGKRIVLL